MCVVIFDVRCECFEWIIVRVFYVRIRCDVLIVCVRGVVDVFFFFIVCVFDIICVIFFKFFCGVFWVFCEFCFLKYERLV